MSSSFSFSLVPIPAHAFFEQAVLQQRLGQRLLQIARLPAQAPDLIRGRFTGRIPGQPFLTGFQKLLRPTVVQAPRYPLTAAQLRYRLLAAKTFQNYPDLLLG